MKRFLFLLLVSMAFVSCAEDGETPKQSLVTARIDGVDHIFNTVNVNTETYTEGDYTWTDVIVTASINNNPDNRISFIVEQNVLGLDTGWYFAYFLNETAFPKIGGFQLSCVENTNHHLQGTFAGQVQADDETAQIIDIELGTFDIVY